MGLISFAGKIVLVLLNIAIIIISLGIVIVGVILKFFPGTILQFIFDAVRGVEQFETPSSFGDLKTVPALDELGMALIIIGLVLLALSFVGCCGACYELKILLLVYIIAMIVITLVTAIVGGLFLHRESSLHNTIKEQLRIQVNNQYKGPTSSDPFSLAINILSFSLKCCGITGTDDFSTSSNDAWKNYTYKSVYYQIDVTPACCKQEILQSDTTFDCARKTAGGSYDTSKTNTQGCYDKILDIITANLSWAIVVLIATIIIMIILMVFAGLLLKNNKVVP